MYTGYAISGWLLILGWSGTLAVHFGHFAILICIFSTHLTLADLILEHGIISGTGAPKFFTRHDLTDINECKGDGEYTKDESKYDQKVHKLLFDCVFQILKHWPPNISLRWEPDVVANVRAPEQ